MSYSRSPRGTIIQLRRSRINLRISLMRMIGYVRLLMILRDSFERKKNHYKLPTSLLTLNLRSILA